MECSIAACKLLILERLTDSLHVHLQVEVSRGSPVVLMARSPKLRT